ncbi:hypothetical protein SteCoe_32528 [Stentor coeruleus]|uniref:Peptidase A1 domain-containing protein n=1 Tax=Stentor coeruleus TaxID=5963 RepID=A0A1R2AYZ3_9CILI|nr:hypothetical protein SteCoe_32528 [Stentor coeruleus]
MFLTTSIALFSIIVSLSSADDIDYSSYTLEVTNINNAFYSLPLKVGSNLQTIQVSLSTYSPVTYFELANPCGRGFDSENSKSYSTNNTNITVDYFKMNISGVVSLDIIEIEDIEKLIKKESFIASKNCSHMDGQTVGAIGLGLPSNSQVKPLFQQYYSYGIIYNPVFSLYLDSCEINNTCKNSRIIVGGWSLSDYAENPDQGFTYHSVPKGSNLWNLELNSIYIRNKKFQFQNLVIIDIEYPGILMPQPYIGQIYNEINNSKTCFIGKDSIICDCTLADNFPDIIFSLDSTNYTLQQSSYVLNQSNKCYILISESPSTYWLLGQLFVRNYYTIWNFGNNSIGIANLKTSKKQHNSKSDKISEGWIIAISVILSVLALGGVAGTYYIIHKRKKAKRQPSESRDSFVSTDEVIINPKYAKLLN